MFSLVPFRSGNVDRRKNPWDMNSIFEDFFKDSMFPTLFENSGQMKVDIRENAENFVVDTEIPGAKKDEINLEIDENMLTISVNRSEEVNDEKENYIRRERRSSSMTRSFAVENIIPDKATAQFENGVLTITLPKREEFTRKSRKINID
ncbi:MAG: Hsp20/alpha crystallin family protein [Dehalobacterium sp.]